MKEVWNPFLTTLFCFHMKGLEIASDLHSKKLKNLKYSVRFGNRTKKEFTRLRTVTRNFKISTVIDF